MEFLVASHCSVYLINIYGIKDKEIKIDFIDIAFIDNEVTVKKKSKTKNSGINIYLINMFHKGKHFESLPIVRRSIMEK